MKQEFVITDSFWQELLEHGRIEIGNIILIHVPYLTNEEANEYINDTNTTK